MQHFLRCALLIFFCQTLNAQDSEVRRWNEDIKLIQGAITQVKDRDVEAVFSDLYDWHPEHVSGPSKFAVKFRDRYLYDESITPLVRSTYIPGVISSFKDFFAPPTLLPSQAVAQLWYLSLKMPYAIAEGSLKESSIVAVANHTAALGSWSFLFENVGMELLTSRTLFALLACWQSAEATDYMDVALRSLQERYEIQKKDQILAVVLQAIKIRKVNKQPNSASR